MRRQSVACKLMQAVVIDVVPSHPARSIVCLSSISKKYGLEER